MELSFRMNEVGLSKLRTGWLRQLKGWLDSREWLTHTPNGEAAANAENNHLWPEAIGTAKVHRAHIMVAVIGKEEDTLEFCKLYVKVLSACCRQPYAAGVYASGVVFEPSFYEDCADMMHEDLLPIFNRIWFGLYESEGACEAIPTAWNSSVGRRSRF